MSTINPYFLDTLLEPLTGLADDDEVVQSFASLDRNNQSQVRMVIREMIVPHARSLSHTEIERVKLAYRFYLSKAGANFERVYNSNLPPFDAPDDPRDFFVWIWEECFPDEDYHLPNADSYIEKPDVNEPLRLAEEAHLDSKRQ